MRNRNLVMVLARLILVLLVALIFSCAQPGSQERGTAIGDAGGVILYGQTYLVDPPLHVGYPAYAIDFSVQNAGQSNIGYWGIYDITDMDSPNWHEGYLSISYANQASSFALQPDESYPFMITMGAGAPAGIYQMEVGVLDKNDVTPNPYIFWVRVPVVP